MLTKEGLKGSSFTFLDIMSLIKVIEFGYGIDNKTLDLKILIPESSELESLRIATQDDVTEDVNFSVIGKEYIPRIYSFESIFKRVESEDTVIDGVNYVAYKTRTDSEDVGANTIPVDRKDLTFITMRLKDDSVSIDTILACDCGEDNMTIVFPMFDIVPLKIAALNTYKAEISRCDISKGFLDKILQIRAIELAICLKDYVKAAEYWRMFYKFNIPMSHKSCGCHG